jgi:hypothetical protein
LTIFKLGFEVLAVASEMNFEGLQNIQLETLFSSSQGIRRYKGYYIGKETPWHFGSCPPRGFLLGLGRLPSHPPVTQVNVT